jgi:ABC-type uncharacterized transport system involved in gliding motility auxiliary subunit
MVNRIVNVVGWVGTALVFGAVAIRFLRPEWNQYATYGAWVGLVCVLVYMLGQWRDVKSVYGSRQARYGTLSLVSVVAVLGILIAINYLATQRNMRWDLTANQVYSLSDQTVRVLTELDAPVRLTVFDQEVNFDRFRSQLTEYEYHGRQLSVEYVDVDRQPGRARQADVQAYGTLLVEYEGRVERVTSASEQDITNAIIKAITGDERRVYFTQGHGEKDPTSSERTGYAAVAQALERDNYGVERLVLAQVADVPDDATVVVIAGPTNDFFPQEIDALERYLSTGGKLMVLLDPAEGAQTGDLPNLRELLRAWAIEVGDNVVVDASGIGQLFGTDASTPVAASYPGHPITERFNLMTGYPFARSVSPIPGGVDGRFAQTIVETGAQSWAETNLAGLLEDGRVALDLEEGDVPGPVSLAVAVSAPAPDGPPSAVPGDEADESDTDEPPPARETRLVAFGDSDFAANFGVGIQGNRDLFMNAVSWLAQQENLIAIRPREPEDRRITLTADQSQRIFLLSMVVIPGLIFGAGVYSWWRRR